MPIPSLMKSGLRNSKIFRKVIQRKENLNTGLSSLLIVFYFLSVLSTPISSFEIASLKPRTCVL